MGGILLDMIENVAALFSGSAHANTLQVDAPNFPNDLEPVIRTEPSDSPELQSDDNIGVAQSLDGVGRC